jgi:hypothetical protein
MGSVVFTEHPAQGGFLATRTARRTVRTLDEATVADPRICREAGCATVLSQYNSTAWCGLHSRRDWRANREPRRRPEMTVEGADEGPE